MSGRAFQAVEFAHFSRSVSQSNDRMRRSVSCKGKVDVLRNECVGPDLGIVLWLALWLSAALLQVYLARWLFKACMFAADVASVRAIHEKRIADLLNQEEARQGSRIV